MDAEVRHELKLACPQDAEARVLMALRLHPLGIRRLHPRRRVQSVYFDTPGNRALDENRDGISGREKLRVRWYGDDVTAVQATLERKSRRNQLGWKQSARLDAPLDVRAVPRERFLPDVRARVPQAWHAALDEALAPVQWIAYSRDYYVTADGAVRITLDRDLRAWDLRLRTRLETTRPSPTPRLLVVELKCAPAAYDAARAITQRLPLSVDRCSKFVLASDLDHGPVPALLFA